MEEDDVLSLSPDSYSTETIRQTRADRLRESATAPDFAPTKLQTTKDMLSESVMHLTDEEREDILRSTGVYASTGTQVSTAIENALIGMNQLPDELAISFGNVANYITGGAMGQELQDIAYDSMARRYERMANREEAIGGIRSELAQLAGGATSFLQLALEGLVTSGALPLAHIGVQAFGEGTYNDMKAYADKHDGSLEGYQPEGFDLAVNAANALLQVGIEHWLGVGSPRFLTGMSRGMWIEGLGGALQEGVQGALADLAEAVKGNEEIGILLDNADQYARDAIIGGLLQGAMGAATYHHNYAKAANNIASAIAKAHGHETPTAEEQQQAEAIVDAKERQLGSVLTTEFKAAFDASTGEGKLQANIAKALNDAVAAQELDLGIDDETERAQRIEQIATQETLNAMDMAREQNRSISEMGMNNIVYRDGAIWLEGMTPEVGQRAVDYARVLAERQTGLAEVQMKLDNINAEIKQTKAELAEAKAQSKEAFIDKLQARLDKQNALAEKRKVQAEQLKAQTEKIQRQIAKELEKAPKQAETKVEEVKAVEEPQKTETQVEMPESKVEVPETKVESAPAKEEPKAEPKPMASIKENMQAYKGEKKSLAVERSGGYKLKVDGELVKIIEKPKGVDFSDAKVYEDKGTYLPKCSMVVKGDNIYIKMFGSRTFPTTYLVIENYKATDPAKIMQAQYDADAGLGNHFEDMIQEFYLKNGLWSLNEGMRLKSIEESIAEDKAREEQQPETREFEAITGSLDTFDARGRMKKSVQNRILNVLTDEQKNKKITTDDGKTTTVGELLIDALSERTVKSKISFDQRKGGIFDDISDEQLDKIIRIARGIDEESVAKRNKPKADYSFPALSEEERDSLPTYDADGNIKPETWDKIRGLFSEERLKKEYKTADGGTETLEDVLKKSVATRDIIWKAVPNEMIKKGAKAYDMTPEELSEVLKIARGQDAVTTSDKPKTLEELKERLREHFRKVYEGASEYSIERYVDEAIEDVELTRNKNTALKILAEHFDELYDPNDNTKVNWEWLQEYDGDIKGDSFTALYMYETGDITANEDSDADVWEVVDTFTNAVHDLPITTKQQALEWVKKHQYESTIKKLGFDETLTNEDLGFEKWQEGKTYQDNDIVILPYKGNPIGVREGDRWLVAESAEEAIRISNDRKRMAEAQKEYEKRKAREKAEAQKKIEEGFLSDEGTAVIPMDYIIEKLKYYDMWDDLKMREKGNMNAIGALVFQDGEIKRGHRNAKTKEGSKISQKTIDTVQEVRRRMKKVAQDIKVIGEAEARRANEYMEAQDAKKPHGEPMEDWTGKTNVDIANARIKQVLEPVLTELQSLTNEDGVIVDSAENQPKVIETIQNIKWEKVIEALMAKYDIDPAVENWLRSSDVSKMVADNPDLFQTNLEALIAYLEDTSETVGGFSEMPVYDYMDNSDYYTGENEKLMEKNDYQDLFRVPKTLEEMETKILNFIGNQYMEAVEYDTGRTDILPDNWFEVKPEQPYLFQEKTETPYDADTIEVDGVERTVYNSEGRRIAKSKEALTNFWRWFGDSKMVDENGQPIVVYHGTDADFTAFEKSDVEGAFFFTDKRKVARKFTTKQDVVETIPGTNIAIGVTNEGVKSFYLKAENINEYNGEMLGAGEERDWRIRADKETMKDGIIIYDADTGMGRANEYIVFDATQIKSTDNIGTFNPDEKNFLKQTKVEGTGSDTKRGGYDERLKRIILKDDADLTTIQHEFAHYWIQNNFKWARSGLASAEWLSRWRGVEEALGIEPQDRYLSRQASEKFARAYERYIMEGKYNEDLKWAFDGFQKFYQDTYEDLESEYFDLSEELDPAIVDWFNRQRPATEAQLKQNAYKKVATVAMAQGASVVTPVNENVSVVSNMNENGEVESQVITTDAETKDSKLAKFSDKKKARRTVEGLREINPDVKTDQYNVLNRAQTVEEAHNWIVRDRAGAWAALNDETTNPIDRAALFQAFKNEAENGDYALGAELAAIKFPKNVTELGQAISVLGERAEFDPLTIIEQKQKSLGEPTETEIASEIKEMGLDADLTDEDVNELKNSTECVL